MTQKGVQTCLKKYGNNYFSKIDKRGATTFWNKYYIKPIGTSKFAIYKRSDNSFVNYFGS